MTRLRVAVVDDSALCRAQLRRFLEVDGDIEVVAEAENGERAIELVATHRVQLLLVDLQMPRVDGHETITRVMAHTPLPILVLTGTPLGPERKAVFESIRRGALDLAIKPSGSDLRSQRELREAVRRLAAIPVVRHVAGKLDAHPRHPVRPSVAPGPDTSAPLVVAIGSSAGGPVALASLVGALAPDLKVAVLVVQHLPAGFSPAFAEFLASRTRLRVSTVAERQPLRCGHVYVAAGEFHFGLSSLEHVGPVAGGPQVGHVPSADVLFNTVASQARSLGAGIVLSGMGEDGKQGLLALRRAGGLCLAQDKESSAVWGMPRAALEAGAVEQALPPLALAEVVTRWARSRRSVGP